jgi:hypothetical protein
MSSQPEALTASRTMSRIRMRLLDATTMNAPQLLSRLASDMPITRP